MRESTEREMRERFERLLRAPTDKDFVIDKDHGFPSYADAADRSSPLEEQPRPARDGYGKRPEAQ